MSSSTMRLDRRPSNHQSTTVTILGSVLIIGVIFLAMIASAYLTPSATRAREARELNYEAQLTSDLMTSDEADRARVFREERLREEYRRTR